MFCFIFSKLPIQKTRSWHNKKGQIIIEYILLIVVSTVVALVLVNFFSVAPPDTGSPPEDRIFFEYWKSLLKAIGQDVST